VEKLNQKGEEKVKDAQRIGEHPYWHLRKLTRERDRCSPSELLKNSGNYKGEKKREGRHRRGKGGVQFFCYCFKGVRGRTRENDIDG